MVLDWSIVEILMSVVRSGDWEMGERCWRDALMFSDSYVRGNAREGSGLLGIMIVSSSKVIQVSTCSSAV